MEMSGYNNNNNNNGWSSGSESGWTGYLDDQSYYNQRNNDYTLHSQSYTLMNCSREDDQEDLSMVSDASSGPPHYFQEDVAGSYGGKNCYSTCTVKLSKKSSEKRSKKSSEKNKLMSKQQSHQHYSYSTNNHLDDTASSPALTYSKMFDDPSSCNQASVEHYMNFPQGISEGHHFNEGSSYTNPYAGFWQSSLPNHTHSAEQSHLSGRRWE